MAACRDRARGKKPMQKEIKNPGTKCAGKREREREKERERKERRGRRKKP